MELVSEIAVLKLGGSLLDLPDLFDRLQALVRGFRPADPLIVVGGGAAADCVRRLDERSLVTDSQAHWTAIDAMTWNAWQLARLDRRLVVVTDRAASLAAWERGLIPVLDAAAFLRAQAASGDATGSILAESWDVTSDSIAAWIAKRWPSERLVLAKSCDPDTGDVDLVDRAFADHARGLAVCWINLRKSPMSIVRFEFASTARD